jgi:hypothetical protein
MRGSRLGSRQLGEEVVMPQLGDKFAQRVDNCRIYFTHYALFEEPDDGIPAAIYIDAATGAPTQELLLTPPINERVFTHQHGNGSQITAPSETSKFLPYAVSPPGFPPTPAPPQVVGTIASITGAPEAVVAANTNIFLCAIGQFQADAQATSGKLAGNKFEVTRKMKFEVKVRVGFLFTPPGGAGQSVGILTGYLTIGMVHQLIGQPPPPNPDDMVLYDWSAMMTLSTDGSYVRQIATEPKPVADPFDPTLTEINFQGQALDGNNNYTVVGHAAAGTVAFTAPPELVLFLFGTTSLTDVEFAVLESGQLVPL